MVESEAALKYSFKCRCRLFDCELSSASLFRHGVYYDSAAGGAVVPQSAVDLLSAEALAADNNRRVQALLSGKLCTYQLLQWGKHCLAANRPQSGAVRLRIYTSARVSTMLC